MDTNNLEVLQCFKPISYKAELSSINQGIYF